MIRKVSFAEVEGMDSLLACAAAVQARTVRIKGQPVKGFFDAGVANYFSARNGDNNDLVLAIARMQYRREATARMHRDVDGKIAQYNLLADRPERPLIRQKHAAIGALTRRLNI